MSVERYNARTAEIHWQRTWDAQDAVAVRDVTGPRYLLPEMVPRPSGRLHMGHVRAYTISDVIARYKRANGFRVVPPIGWNACGLSGENAATAGTVLRSLGLSLDWSREATADDLLAGMAAANGPRTATVIETGTPTANSAIDPGDIIDTYGADATRWHVLSDSPPQRDVVWTEAGIHGAWRFVQRLWRLTNNIKKFSNGGPEIRPPAFSDRAMDLRKSAHRTLVQVSGNIEGARFNICVARIYAFARALDAGVTDPSEPAGPDLKFAACEAAEIMVQIFHPMMPHLAEACWASLGHTGLLATRRWPQVETGLLMESAVTVPVHVNGRKRADVTVARDARNGNIEASVLALDAVRRALDGKAPRKVIIVPQRIINVVA